MGKVNRDNSEFTMVVELLKEWVKATRKGSLNIGYKRPGMSALATKGGVTPNITPLEEDIIDNAMGVLKQTFNECHECLSISLFTGADNTEIGRLLNLHRNTVDQHIKYGVMYIGGALTIGDIVEDLKK